MIVTNHLFNKFFPCVFMVFFLISKILPSGVIFLYLVFKHMKLEGNKLCSLLHWDTFFSFGISCMLTSLTFGLSALCDCVEAEYEFRISACVCVCASVCLCVRETYPHE